MLSVNIECFVESLPSKLQQLANATNKTAIMHLRLLNRILDNTRLAKFNIKLLEALASAGETFIILLSTQPHPRDPRALSARRSQ